MLFQIFNVVNARSDSKCVRPFTFEPLAVGRIGGSIVLQVLVVYVPFLQRAFGTVGLSARDWVFCVRSSALSLMAQGSKQTGSARDALTGE
jgi:P-type Ca2+ transporter type 2C